MGDLIQFPGGEPAEEMPGSGYCMSCGCPASWPPPGNAWPQSCPNGCTPFNVQSHPLGYQGANTAQIATPMGNECAGVIHVFDATPGHCQCGSEWWDDLDRSTATIGIRQIR